MIHWMLAWFFGLIVACLLSVMGSAALALSGGMAMCFGLFLGMTVPLLFIKIFGDL